MRVDETHLQIHGSTVPDVDSLEKRIVTVVEGATVDVEFV